jgi:hypothetical protein
MRRFLAALARVDRWLVMVGRNCCAGRAQASLEREVRAAEKEDEALRQRA